MNRTLASGARKLVSLSKILTLSWLAMYLTAGADAQSKPSRLHRIDQLSQAAQQGSISPATLAEAVLSGARNRDLAGATPLRDQLTSAHSAYLSRAEDVIITDFSVTAAFDEWRNLIKAPQAAPTSPLALHMYRGLLLRLTTSLVAKDDHGLPSRYLSPAEGLYLFDELMATGGVPSVENNAARPDTRGYDAAVAAYVASTTAERRQEEMAEIVSKYLLLKAD